MELLSTKYWYKYLFLIFGVFLLGVLGNNSGEIVYGQRVYSLEVSLKEKIVGDYKYLLNKADQEEKVLVVVELKEEDHELSLSKVVSSNASVQALVLSKIERADDVSIKKATHLPYMGLEVTRAELEELVLDANIVLIQEDIPEPPALAQSIPITNTDDAWGAGYTGDGWVVAILDTGVDKAHSFFSSKVVSEACYSTTNATYNSTTVCPGGGGEETGSGTGVHCLVTGCNHGTHVAGIAAGNGTNSGVAKDADIIAIQVFSRFDDDVTHTICLDNNSSSPCILAYVIDQILGLDRVYALRSAFDIAAANLSIAGENNTTYCDGDSRKASMDNLKAAGIATVVASGNEGYIDAVGSPGCISTAITVGATYDTTDQITTYSNSATMLDLLAPGSYIYSSVPGGGFDTMNGTSMATPHVAGAFAVLREAFPSATVGELETLLEDTGADRTDPGSGIITPRIDLQAAINSMECTPPGSGDWTVTQSCTLTSNTTITGNITVNSGVQLTINSGVTLNIDFVNKYLMVKNEGGVFIKDGGKVD